MQLATTSSKCFEKRVLWIMAAAVVVVLLVLAIVFRHFLWSGLDLVAEGTGSRWSAALCLVLAVLVLVWLLAWLLLPFFVYFGLRDLRRRTAELDRTVKLCVQNLMQNTPGSPTPKFEDAPKEQGPGSLRSG